jgi:hypothetical protein
VTKKRPLVELPPGMRDEAVLAFHWALMDLAPQVYHWMNQQDDFGQLSFKRREDGSVLAIAKGYGPDGTPVVAFGAGYDIVSACKGLEGTFARNGWRPDKPWSPNSGGGD